MFVPDVLYERGGAIIDQSGSEAHGAHALFIHCVDMCASRESVCPYNTSHLHNVS